MKFLKIRFIIIYLFDRLVTDYIENSKKWFYLLCSANNIPDFQRFHSKHFEIPINQLTIQKSIVGKLSACLIVTFLCFRCMLKIQLNSHVLRVLKNKQIEKSWSIFASNSKYVKKNTRQLFHWLLFNTENIVPFPMFLSSKSINSKQYSDAAAIISR